MANRKASFWAEVLFISASGWPRARSALHAGSPSAPAAGVNHHDVRAAAAAALNVARQRRRRRLRRLLYRQRLLRREQHN